MAEDITAGADEREAMNGDEAAANLRGWLEGRLILSEASVRTLLNEREQLLTARVTTYDAYAERVRHLNAELSAATARVETAEAALETLRGQLLAEREAWREGSVARLEQRTGMKVKLVLAPKDQCTATIDIWGMRCEKIGGHPELHYARTDGGHVEWRVAEEGGGDEPR